MSRNSGAGSTQGPTDEGTIASGEFPMLIAGKSSTTAAAVKRVPVVDSAGNLQVTGSLSISGSVTVSGSVSVSNFPATQAVSGTVAVSNFPATQPVSGTVTANQGTQGAGGTASWPVQGAAAAAAAVSGNPLLIGLSDLTNVQTIRQPGVGSGSIAVTGIQAMLPYMWTGSNLIQPMLSAIAAGAAGLGSGVPPSALYLYNGATHDGARNNIDVTLLASGARTTTQTSADITTFNLQALTVTLDMTVVGAGPSVTVSIDGKDPASGKYYNLLTGTAITTISTNMYRIDPVLPAVANATAQLRLPRIIRIVVTANNANSGTYSVGYTLHSTGG